MNIENYKADNICLGWRLDSNWGICYCLCSICVWGINWWVESDGWDDNVSGLCNLFIDLFAEYAGILLQLKVRVSVKKPQPRKINSRRASCEDQVKLNSTDDYFCFYNFNSQTFKLYKLVLLGSTDKYSKSFKWNQKPRSWLWCTC